MINLDWITIKNVKNSGRWRLKIFLSCHCLNSSQKIVNILTKTIERYPVSTVLYTKLYTFLVISVRGSVSNCRSNNRIELRGWGKGVMFMRKMPIIRPILQILFQMTFWSKGSILDWVFSKAFREVRLSCNTKLYWEPTVNEYVSKVSYLINGRWWWVKLLKVPRR